MSDIPVALHDGVVARAGGRCEYCRLSQLGQEAAFHIDHVRPRAAGGPTTLENLALACVSCSLRKGARETGIDPVSGEDAPLFNPRTQAWDDHFRWEGPQAVATTATGRATVAALSMNRPSSSPSAWKSPCVAGTRRDERIPSAPARPRAYPL